MRSPMADLHPDFFGEDSRGRGLLIEVGLNEKTIAKYIHEQGQADIALDRLSVKEHEDPSGGYSLCENHPLCGWY